MSDNILVDGKPLHLLRVVDLRDELKKRGIKATGTKLHLQELLKSAILSESDASDFTPDKPTDESNKTDENSQENSNGSSDNNSASEEKVASISINEATETIKLTIRSSPRKSEPTTAEKAESETESSQSETDSNDSPKAQSVEKISDQTSPVNDDKNDDDNSTDESIESGKHELTKDNEVGKDDYSNQYNHGGFNHIKENDKQEPTQVHIDKSQDNSKEVAAEFEEPAANLQSIAPDEPLTLTVDKSELEEDLLNSKLAKGTKPLDEELVLHSESTSVEEVSMPLQTSMSEKTNNSSQSSSPDEKATKSEEAPEQESKNKPSIRGRLFSHSKSVSEEDVSKPVQKKRRWGGSNTNETSSVLNKGISSDKLKQIIIESAQVVEVVDSSAKVSKANEVDEDEPVQSTTELINTEADPKEDVTDVDLPVIATSNNNASTENETANKKNTNKESQDQVDQAPENASRPLSPAKNPESKVLFVTGLVRPYTLPQLKKLLSSAGPIDEEKFWIDKIKSKCYAVYLTVEEAAKTRETLHNLKWPQSSPKNLSVEFATLEDVDRCLNPENYEDLPPPKSKPANENNNVENVKKVAGIEISKGKYDIILNEPIRDKGQPKNVNNKDDPSGRNIREWDRNKVNLATRKENEEDTRKRIRLSPPPTQDKKDKIRERSKSPEVKRKRNDEKTLREANKKSESPAKMLEDLFRKTKATPYIYWLPLTDEQSVEKEKQRALVEKERLARIAARKDLPPPKRENSPPHRPPAPVYHNMPRDRPKFQDFRRRSPSPQRRKRSLSQSPRRYSRYSRSRSPDNRRFSPRRRR